MENPWSVFFCSGCTAFCIYFFFCFRQNLEQLCVESGKVLDVLLLVGSKLVALETNSENASKCVCE